MRLARNSFTQMETKPLLGYDELFAVHFFNSNKFRQEAAAKIRAAYPDSRIEPTSIVVEVSPSDYTLASLRINELQAVRWRLPRLIGYAKYIAHDTADITLTT